MKINFFQAFALKDCTKNNQNLGSESFTLLFQSKGLEMSNTPSSFIVIE